jgi:ubiquinone/menaquinone biosynthesis C-methylase UbiE
VGRDYVSVQYDPSLRPITSYPDKLAKRLCELHRIPHGAKLLEVGAGRPDVLNGFKRQGLQVFGCDISPASKEACEKDKIPFKLVDFVKHALPYKDNSFDVVYSKSVIEHMPEVLEFVTECRRVLKPGGIFLALTPDWNANYKTFFDDFTHVRPMTRRSMRLILGVADFDSVDSYRFRQLPITWRSSFVNGICACIAPFVPANTRRPFFRWSRELMLVGTGKKPAGKIR